MLERAAARAVRSRSPETSARRSRAFLGERAARDFVCEVSSFQLEAIDRFRAGRRGADERHARPPRPLRELRGLRRGQGAALRAAARRRRRHPQRRRSRLARHRRRRRGACSSRAGDGARPAEGRVAARRASSSRTRPASGTRSCPRSGSRCPGRTTSRTPSPAVAAAECLGRSRGRDPRRPDAVPGPAAPHRARRRGRRRPLDRRLQGHQRGRDREVARGIRGRLASS